MSPLKENAATPVAIIIAGSGPTDRDGNDAAMGLNTNSYKMLATALAKNGIASLRYDKRMIGESNISLPIRAKCGSKFMSMM